MKQKQLPEAQMHKVKFIHIIVWIFRPWKLMTYPIQRECNSFEMDWLVLNNPFTDEGL